VYLAKTNNEIIGFIFLSIRTEYVEGSSISPVGYIEGIYVREKFRKKGIGRRLYEKAKLWLQSKGIQEIGSDTEIDNQTSILFHKRLGFEEASQNIHFIKQI
jgi:aminoglycoside 6'-N-acetyltransferase I